MERPQTEKQLFFTALFVVNLVSLPASTCSVILSNRPFLIFTLSFPLLYLISRGFNCLSNFVLQLVQRQHASCYHSGHTWSENDAASLCCRSDHDLVSLSQSQPDYSLSHKTNFSLYSFYLFKNFKNTKNSYKVFKCFKSIQDGSVVF